MAEATTAYPAEQWKCLACAETWEINQLAGGTAERCPECRGPLRHVPTVRAIHDRHADRSLVALSDDQQWLVVHWPDYGTPWTVLQRLDEIDGYQATGDTFEDSGQSAADVLAAFLTRSREISVLHLEHAAAD